MWAAHFHWLLVSIIRMSPGPEIFGRKPPLMRLLPLVAANMQEEIILLWCVDVSLGRSGCFIAWCVDVFITGVWMFAASLCRRRVTLLSAPPM